MTIISGPWTADRRRAGSRHPGAALLVLGDEVPGWAEYWCRHTGRELRRRTVPAPAPAAFPGSVERVRAIADIATTAARDGAAVLAVAGPSRNRTGSPRVVVAIRAFPDDAAALADAADVASIMGAELVIAHGVPAAFAERSVGLGSAVERAHDLLDAAVARTSTARPELAARPWLARVRPHELVGEQLDADLLVLGGARPGGAVGLVACSALHHAPCAVLLSPRPAGP
jgi:hypothetical protein